MAGTGVGATITGGSGGGVIGGGRAWTVVAGGAAGPDGGLAVLESSNAESAKKVAEENHNIFTDFLKCYTFRLLILVSLLFRFHNFVDCSSVSFSRGKSVHGYI